MIIKMEHGSGGRSTTDLIDRVFKKYFENEYLCRLEDAAVVPVSTSRIAMTTDSFVVHPLFFKGGDIGKLAVYGTVNDLLMMGATPKYITSGFIIQEGVSFDTLEAVAKSMAMAAKEAGVVIVAGDTKVVEGHGELYINTSGVGLVPEGIDITPERIQDQDAVILSGSLGNHQCAIMSVRMGIENTIESDCAPLFDIVTTLLKHNIKVHAMRDVTRGGLATVLNEFAKSAGVRIDLQESEIPIDEEVAGFCEILGLEPLYMANEGKLVCVVAKEDAQKAFELIKTAKYGGNARMIGSATSDKNPIVTISTRFGGKRILDVLQGEGLPRIC